MNTINKMCNFKPNLQIIIILYISISSYISQVQGEGIICYKCVMTIIKPEDEEILCSHFNTSNSKFQVFCPTSTLCMKRTTQYSSRTSVVTTTQRDCAPQKYTSYDYDYADKTWYKKHEVVRAAYDEGCFTGEHRGAPTAPPEYCFCSFALCNSSSRLLDKAYEIILVLLIARLL